MEKIDISKISPEISEKYTLDEAKQFFGLVAKDKRNAKGQFKKGSDTGYHQGMAGKKHSRLSKNKISAGNTKKKIFIICKQCGKSFEVVPSWSVKVFCSRVCFGKFNKGKPTWNTGKKGVQIAWNKGKKFPEISGKNHYNWRGGVATENDKLRHSFEANLWKKACLERDNHTCQKYGVKTNLVVHHINNFSKFPELRTSLENGITLSDKAHKEFHRKYGKENNTSSQWKEFLCY